LGIEKSFLILNFFKETFVTLACLHFLNQHKYLDFLNISYDLFQEKTIPLSEEPFFNFLAQMLASWEYF
jgi:hypothetical protein